MEEEGAHVEKLLFDGNGVRVLDGMLLPWMPHPVRTDFPGSAAQSGL